MVQFHFSTSKQPNFDRAKNNFRWKEVF